MPAHLVLVRHGPSAHLYPAGLVRRAGIQRWRDAHDMTGIVAACQPPASLVQLAAQATHIVASDLRRATDSAERLAFDRPVAISAMLRETALPIPHWPIPLPLRLWEALIHIRWGYQILRGTDCEPEEHARAAAAAAWLSEMVDEGSMVLAVTHGVFRRLVSRELIARGWTGTGRRGGYGHWSAWSFTRPALPKGT
jgi:broad specificity phosphatase PhoE